MFIDPKAVVAQLPLNGNEIVIDLGTGSGVYSIEMAKRVALGGGKVYAVDVQQDMLTRLAHTAKEAKLSNVSFIHSDFEKYKGVQLKDAIADFVIISNTLYCAEHKEAVLKEAARLTRAGGLLLLIDWNSAYKGMGPMESQVVTQEVGEKLAISAGFEAMSELVGGPHHWAILMKRTVNNEPK